MSFKTSKICAVLVSQVAWLAVTFLLFGGLTSPDKTAPWMAVMAMFFILPLTVVLWSALTLLGVVAGRTAVKPLHLYPLGAALAGPAAVGVVALVAGATFARAFDSIITRSELITFAAATAIPGVVAGLFLALFGAPAPVLPMAARKPLPAIEPLLPVLTEIAGKLRALIAAINPSARIAPLLLPNMRADAAQFIRAGSLLSIGLAALLVLNFLRVMGGPLGSLANTLMLIGQAAFLWCVLCLFANRLRGLGQSPFWALAPAALAAAFVFTGPPDAAEWQAPLSVLLVYVITGAVLCTFKGEPAAESEAPARSFGLRQSQPRI